MTRVEHGSFTLERVYPASPARVFAAFTTKAAKSRWFSCFEGVESSIEIDFRVGGREVNRLTPPGGVEHLMQGTFHDIVEGERFVSAFTMHLGGTLISVSLLTVQVRPEGAGARLIVTEQGVFYGDYALAEREEGTAVGLDRLADLLAAESTASEPA